MTASTNHIPYGSKSLGTYPADYSYSKTLSTNSNKSLAGGMGADPAVAGWVEQNRYIFDAIMSGACDLSPQEQGQFMEWWNWAMSQLQGAGQGWDPAIGGGQYPGQGQALPAGAIPGAQGNAVFDQMDANIDHAPYAQPIDIYSNNIVINSGSMMTTFTCEVVTDTRTNPSEQVLAVKGSDGTVYYIHDYEDANVTIKTPVEDMVTDTSGTSLISWQQYTGPAAGGTETGQVVNGPAPTKNEAGEWEIEAASMDEVDTIDMKPTGSGVEGEEELWRVWGHLNVSVAPSDKVQVLDGADSPGDGGYRIVITHKDGSKDVIIAMPGTRNININADPLNVSWGEEGTVNPSGLVPGDFSDAFTVNGGVSVENLSEEEGGFLGELMETTGKSAEEIIEAMNEAGLKTADGKSYEGIEDVVKAIQDGHFPPAAADISFQFIEFVTSIDPTFLELNGEYFDLINNNGSHGAKSAARQAMTQRLVELLDILYPEEVKVELNQEYDGGFIIDGVHFFYSHSEDGLGDYITKVDVEANKSYKDYGSGFQEE